MIRHIAIAADACYWQVAAREVRAFAAECDCPPNRLQSILWLLGGAQARCARLALRDSLNSAFIPPRMMPLAQWLQLPLSAGVAARAEMFTALRGNTWIRETFGFQPAALWALARHVTQLCDELTWAAVTGDALEGRLNAALARHFSRRAARAMEPQAQLILQLWRARRGDDPVAQALRELAARAANASAPLVYSTEDALEGWEGAFLDTYARRAPVLLLRSDFGAAMRARPLLAAAWPELAGTNDPAPIAARAAGVSAGCVPLQILVARSLEEEAMAVARQVLEWRRAGLESIALVALDRLAARRARALLERAQVAVRDETGWKLSTMSAAAAVMRWFDLVADDAYWRDLLDWLKSPFVLHGRATKVDEIAAIERSIRAAGIVQGIDAVRRAVADRNGSATPSAQEILALIETELLRMRRAGPTFAAHATALAASLDALGMRTGLQSDPVGRAVLREIDALAGDLAHIGSRASIAELRELLADRFEEVPYIDRQVDSPVVMLSLAASMHRPFDAALLIGADARHLPARVDAPLMSDAVRAELGLAAAASAARRQAQQLAGLLATVPQVVATWRMQMADEPNAVSPLIERLRFVSRASLGDDLLRAPPMDRAEVEPLPVTQPAPSAQQLLPESISASQAQSLVNCPYQFFARHLLRLGDLEDVIEMPDKRDFGELLHSTLCRFHRAQGAVDFGGIEPAHLEAGLREEAQAVFGTRIERMPGLLSLARRFDGLVPGYVQWLRSHAAAGWRWQASEAKHRRAIALLAGRRIELVGRVDRIDAHADGRLQVLDYKARPVDALKRGLRDPGEDVQLPFYGLLLPGCAEAAYVGFDRGREDDPGVGEVTPPQPLEDLVRQVGVRLQRDLQRIAEGAPLPAIGAQSVCAYCSMRGLCRRDHWNGMMEGQAR